MRTIVIPGNRVAEHLIDASFRRAGANAYGCIVCGLAVKTPKFHCHVIDGGGIAVHTEDDALYQDDGGDMGWLPVGTDCLRRHPELKPFVYKA